MVLCKYSSLLAFQGAITGSTISSGMETRIRRIKKSSKNYHITMKLLDTDNLQEYCIDGAYICIIEAIHKKISKMTDEQFRFLTKPVAEMLNEAVVHDIVFDVFNDNDENFPEDIKVFEPINIESMRTNKRSYNQISPSSVNIE
jgi:hypothetical protein